MRHVWRFCHHPRWQLVNLPRTYFEVKDDRPHESEGQANLVIFVLGGISIPGELNQNILKFLTGKDLLRVATISKTVERVVRKCKALLFDAILERIDEFADQKRRQQVNLHGCKKKNCVRVCGINGVWIDGYCVRVTPKYAHFVHSKNIFERHPDIDRVKNTGGVVHMRPYIRNVVEVVQHWRVESRSSRQRVIMKRRLCSDRYNNRRIFLSK